jgi:anaerobic C4-dicarboxylate transporter
MISLLVSVLVVLLVGGLIVWLIRLLGPSIGLPPVFIQAAVAVVAVLIVIWLIYALLGHGGLAVHDLG